MGLGRGTGEVLRASVARPGNGPTIDELSSRLTSAELHGLARAAAYHGIAGYVHAAAAHLPVVPEEERTRLEAVRKRTAMNHLRGLAQLRFLRDTFDDAGIPWLVVKGPTLATPVHGASDLRWYGDLDVVVPPRQLEGALTALEARGCETLDRNWRLIHAEMKGEVHVRLPMGTELDLHWHLLNDLRPRGAFSVPIPALFERSQQLDVGGIEVPTLDPADTVVYVVLHMMLSGADRLVWVKDLERLLALPSAPPPATLERARAWGVGLALVAALDRMDRAVGSPPAARELLEDAPRRRVWTKLSRLAWARSPVEREDGGPSLARVVARSVRPTQRGSMWELTRKTWEHLRSDGATDHTQLLPADDPRSDRYDAGGEEARSDYLAAVARYAVPD
jgi:hypothetical protein